LPDELPLSLSSIHCRLEDLRAKLQTGKDPAKPVIFLTRMVIECLSKGEWLC
jgi:hypothetical protein